jgi:hypothetical protein
MSVWDTMAHASHQIQSGAKTAAENTLDATKDAGLGAAGAAADVGGGAAGAVSAGADTFWESSGGKVTDAARDVATGSVEKLGDAWTAVADAAPGIDWEMVVWVALGIGGVIVAVMVFIYAGQVFAIVGKAT